MTRWNCFKTCAAAGAGRAAPHDPPPRFSVQMAERFFPERYKSAQRAQPGPGAGGAGAADAEGHGGGESDEDDLEAELAAMRSKARKRRAGYDVFEAADTVRCIPPRAPWWEAPQHFPAAPPLSQGVKGLVMIRMTLPGVAPSDLASKTLKHLREAAEQRSRCAPAAAVHGGSAALTRRTPPQRHRPHHPDGHHVCGLGRRCG